MGDGPFENAIVMDNGSNTCRLGIAGEEAPRFEYSNCIGRLYNENDKDEFFVGYKAQEKREVLSLHYPIQRGIITDWDDMAKIWDFGFSKQLQVSSSELAVMTSEPPLNPLANSETMAEVMFEKFAVPYFQVVYEPKSIFMGLGRDWGGLLVNIGHGVTYVTTHYEGHGPTSLQRSDFGGEDLTKYLQHALYNKGYSFTSTAELEMLASVKEKTCFIPYEDDVVKDISSASSDCTYTLPDGSNLLLGAERWKCPELLFHSDGVFNTGPSLLDMILGCYQETCMTTRKDMGFVILSGGTSLCVGLKEKLEKVLSRLVPFRVRVVALEERKYAAWLGQSIAASLTSFESCWISKQEYAEYGPCCVHGMR